MPRTKGSKNKPKTVTADFATQIAEKQSAKEALTAEIASITATYSVIEPSVDVIYVVLHTCNSVVVKPSSCVYFYFLKTWLD